MSSESVGSAGSSSGSIRYDDIGRTYAITRKQDPRIAAQIRAALGSGGPVVNVGAGTGNYEPVDLTVVAVDPSVRMLVQREQRSRLVVRGVAERLPFPDRAFEVALATFTVQHWDDRKAGLRELGRVSHRQVVVCHQPTEANHLWMGDYFDEDVGHGTGLPESDLDLVHACLQVREVRPVLVPRDCIDGFGGAFWARPEAYLDPVVQAGSSSFAQLDPAVLSAGIERLRRDLQSGAWDDRHGHLRALDEIDIGYRLLVAGHLS